MLQQTYLIHSTEQKYPGNLDSEVLERAINFIKSTGQGFIQVFASDTPQIIISYENQQYVFIWRKEKLEGLLLFVCLFVFAKFPVLLLKF